VSKFVDHGVFGLSLLKPTKPLKLLRLLRGVKGNLLLRLGLIIKDYESRRENN